MSIKSISAGHSGELGAIGQTLGRPVTLIGRPELAEWYERLGRWVGPFGTRTAQAELVRTWLETGEEGAAWLVGQLLCEQHADAISGSSRVLLQMRGAAAPHVVAALAMSARSEAVVPAVTFLRIVRDLDAESVGPWLPQISEILHRLVDHFDKDVRLAAFHTCIDLLPVEQAKRVLAHRRAKEADPELAELLESFLRQ
ncbi:MAG: hypothetical protein Q7S58_21290 [Candidatus Binatus sp.]|uniref:hypothetical protein n=1 Tax=Candidatus Binatus sp. TaxID=2811406 RepID=UPI00271E5DBF|nr:hypothetical protein [Candidatus Binatus sp.]MDO8434942.1 hypothetical protein [Candidatus Binatus sp.]